ncbi:TetR/AcrR family transcriptional regulator [Cohnella silvisoli]|uniref:TetR/AcrR family transcriptional regulator n=1 Tax=Cohnella silvisoli TaxID=2873699 RepID=A0ABV1KWF4_9BACL|nr:TetR/AcrR family transcriptional regulator [Cohnella silvisoli]MCD9023703.1 TetR/AcrR family transcriptional regulator [Cohnella silvisoli]
MKQEELGTSDKILSEAIELFHHKGFKSVTMKEIAAAAAVSEMTVFRHFETKLGVLEAAIRKYSYIQPMKKLFEEQIVWDLYEDLKMFAKTYHESMSRNKAISFIAIQERNNMPWITELAEHNPGQLKELLTRYFQDMQAQGKMVAADSAGQATAFMTLNFGYFMSCNPSIKSTDTDAFIENSVQTFARGLRP